MTKPESLEISRLESLFETVEPEIGSEATRTIIGELEDNKLARIRRVAAFVLGRETEHHKYLVDLSAPFRKSVVTIVYSSLWEVSPQAAAKSEVLAEQKSDEKYAIYHPKAQRPLTSAEDIFTWYDEPQTKKGEYEGKLPDISPNIYTVEGMEELIDSARFKEWE